MGLRSTLTSFIEGYWINQKNHKKFLLDLAASHGFDPLIPANWYRLQLDDFKEFKVLYFLYFLYFSDFVLFLSFFIIFVGILIEIL